MRLFTNRLWERFLEVAMPFFRSPLRGRSVISLLIIVGFLLMVNALNVLNSYVGRDFMTALEMQEFSRFYLLAGALAGVFAASTAVQVMERYTEDRLGLTWRQWLTTQFLERYLANHTYYRLANTDEVDNPDQRMSDDVKTFTATTLSFLVLGFNGLLTLFAFTGVLWSITPLLVFAAILYAAVGSLGTILLGKRLVALDHDQLQKEGNFRYALGRVREHAASIAQLKGEPEEKARLGGKLTDLVANFRSIINVNRDVGFFVTAYNYMPQIIPAAIVAPLFMSGHVQFGAVTQAAMAFSQVLGAFSLIITQFQQISAYAAVVHRLGSMWEATEPPPPSPSKNGEEPTLAPTSLVLSTNRSHGSNGELPVLRVRPRAHSNENGRTLAFRGLTLRTPGEKRVLIRDLSLEVVEGKRLLISGPNGSGKTALLLATAGLWEEAHGEVVRPGADTLMIVPEQPYLAPGRLRELLLYGLQGAVVPDAALRSALNRVGMGYLLDHPGGLDAEVDWGAILSAGEQQALTFVRVLLKHPKFALLDGVGGDLDPERLRRLYGALRKTSITYCTVGDAPALLEYHELHLELFGDGRWRVGPAARPVKGK